MSPATTAPTEPAPQETTTAGQGGRVYRGRTVAELIPRIQADLGPEAIVLRRRSGLEGGLGGFFQRPFVEIEARGGNDASRGIAARGGGNHPGAGGNVDLYDGATETPASAMAAALDEAPALDPPHAPTPELSALELATSVPQAFVPEGDDFADALAAAGIAISDNRVNGFHTTLPPVPAQPHVAATPVPAPAPAVTAPDAVASAAYAAAGTVAPAPAPAATKSKARQTLAAKLVATGVQEHFARELIDAAAAHVLAFNPRAGVRQALQLELQRRIPSAPALPATGATIVFVGPGGSGKTRCADALATIYGRGALNVTRASILPDAEDGSLKVTVGSRLASPADACSTRALRALGAAKADGVVLLDTPSLSPADRGEVRRLAKLLEALAPERVVLALPATLGVRACSQLLDALASLKPNALAITHADETDQLGVAVQAACETGIGPEYMLAGGGGERALSRLDPVALTERLLR
jgi:flagellar biosynthesis GTPase FlhF